MSLANIKTVLSGLTLILMVTGCGEITEEEKNAELGALNAIDATGLSDIMLNLADPNEAVAFFRKTLAEKPGDPDITRNLALALVRAKKYDESVLVFEQLIDMGVATGEDRLAYADSLVRNGAWDEARVQLDKIPPTVENFRRYFLEALIADHNKEWEKADRFYDVARGLTARPGQVLNNWGISKTTRGRASEAEKLFKQAIAADPNLFPAKNNLVISRAKRKVYELPIMPATDVEKALLMHNIARQAIENGDRDIAAGLLETAIDLHPQHFAAAVALLGSL